MLSPENVFSLVMEINSLVIGFGMVKIGRSLKLEMLLLMSRLCTRIGQVQNLWLQLELEKFEFVSWDEIYEDKIQNKIQEIEETVDPQVEQETPTTAIQRSFRNIIPPRRYSPSLWSRHSFMVSWRRYLYTSTIGIRSARKGECGVRTEDELIWLETSSKTMVHEFW
jgi:hypothetical protein